MELQYPILRPVPIRTKGKNVFSRIGVWLFESRKWELMADWSYDFEFDGRIETIFIKKGFVFDGASVPRFLWPILLPTGILLIPGLVHDHGYRHWTIRVINKNGGEYKLWCNKRAFWDKMFRDMSIEVNGCKVVSYAAWAGIRAFGWMSWRKEPMLLEI